MMQDKKRSYHSLTIGLTVGLVFGASHTVRSEAPRQELISLNDSLAPLRERFNAHKGEPNVLAILSPTCAGCVYAARAMADSVVKDNHGAKMTIHVVWVPMVGGDSKSAALEESQGLSDSRVIQYWDPQRRVGAAFSTQVFPNWTAEGASVLNKDHWLHESLSDRSKLPPEERPLWDIVFFFKPDTTWDEAPPKPANWVKQIGFYGAQADGTSGAFWRNQFAQAPFDSDWFVELAREMKAMGSVSPQTTAPSDKPQAQGITQFPQTTGGIVAKAFIDAFNTQTEEAVTAFNETYRCASALQQRSIKERTAAFRQLWKEWGRLQVLNIVSSGERKITVTVMAQTLRMKRHLEFVFEEKEPRKLDVIYIRSDERPISEAPSERFEIEHSTALT